LSGNLIIPENSNLLELDICYNQFSGELIIPENGNLEKLDAFDNNFTGQLVIPENSNLIELDVNWNELTGNLIIPENSNLKYLYASGNKLTGNLIIPENSNLERLIIRNNQLIGELIIPENYNLKELCISNNQLSGKLSIPENSNLIELDVSNNQLTGNLIIPENSNLRDLYVINNNLTGKLLIPKNSKLRLLDVRNNQLEGKLIIPENPYFEILDASDNQLTGDLIIPKSSNLSELYVNDNQLTGRLIISENSNLKNLYISNNQLKGKLTIPKNIKVINAHGNKFDSIYAPFKFDNHLINLDISSNQFNNNIFETLSKFNQLLYLDISNNNMNGTLIIPKTIETVKAHENRFNSISCSFPYQLLTLDISSNQFNDDVFETLLKFDKIQDLNLSGNNLKKLPSNFFKLQTLRVLALENIPHLNVKLINFENSPIENCFLRGTSISCYQKGTCLQIDTDEDIDYYDECSNKVINNMLYSNSEDKKNYEEVDKVDKSSLSNDCLQINKFLNKNERSNCCHITGIECDENNRIIELNLNNENNSFPGTLDFNKFPILQNLKFLKFNYFEMNSLSSKFFELPSLESLFIWNANLQTLPKTIIDESPIKNLDLYDNLIKEFPYQFSSLKKLRYLSLGKNKINEELTDDILKFNLLEYLKINDNNLIGKLIVPPLLQVISAQYNNLNSIGLNNNSLLEKLYLDNNSFEETIFNDLIKFENLYWLYLMKNKKIKNIPPLIYKLKNIEIIDLKETGIEELPSNFFKFSNIKRLYLSSDSQKFKIIKFVNSPIDYCYFYNTPIFCVEPETCNNVKTDKYNSCSVDTINDIKNSQTITKENEKEFNGKNSNEIFYSKDCEFLKEFLSLPLNTNCCSLENMIECDKNNNILKLKLNMNNDYKTDFSKFPILNELNELEITSANINTLPSVLFSLTNLQTLNINKSKITEITNDIDPRCVLETINLSDNNLKKFPYQFNIISSLKYLNLTNNSITEEFQNKILSFPSIENIYLDNNHISGELFIPESVKIFSANNNKFNSIPTKNVNYSLETLTLQGNSFNGDIFNNLTQFKELNYLDLSYNKKIRSIPQSIEKLNKLRTLNLKETNLKELPYGIFKLSSLKNFSLESSSSIFKIIKFENEKTECTFYDTPILCYQTDSCINVDNNLYRNCTPEEINEVKSKLSIQTSEKKEISKDCEQFSTFVSKPLNLDCCEEFGISCDENDSIKKLYINNEQNSIIEYYIDNSESIDFENFPNLSNIEKIEIANIELKKIPTVFFQLPLKILKLNRNNLMGELPNEFKDFKNIQEINLNENYFSGKLLIPKSLKALYAENNNFNIISDITLDYSLEILSVPGNGFTGEIFNTLIQFKNLKELILNNNQKIEYIPPSIKELFKLEILKLNGINIKEFPNELFLLPNLIDIQIGSKQNVSAKIVHFYQSPNVFCEFNNIDLLCYEPGTCYNIPIKTNIPICTVEEINEINPYYNDKYLIENIILNQTIIDSNENINSNQRKMDSNENINSNQGKMDSNEIIINNISNDITNRYKSKNDKENKENKEKDKDKDRNKQKNKSKNKKENQDEEVYIYIIVSLICINGTIITTLAVICLCSYRNSKNRNENENIDDMKADIVISEKITIFNKKDIQEEHLILNNNHKKTTLNHRKNYII